VGHADPRADLLLGQNRLFHELARERDDVVSIKLALATDGSDRQPNG
jgi:hypothetical protein